MKKEYEIIYKPIVKNPRYIANVAKSKYGYMQHSTGTPGAMADIFIKNWDGPSAKAETEFVIDNTGIHQLMPIGIRTWHCGGSGNNTHVGCEVCEPAETRLLEANWIELYKGNKKNPEWAVKRLQQELLARGYNPNGIDGSFGPGCDTAVKNFQRDKRLDVDGHVGKQTLRALQDRKGSYMAYDVEHLQPYFEDVYAKAVWLCAYVLDRLGSSVSTDNALSHAEGYIDGIASNHADVGHWWPEHGKSMDDFRIDVVKYIETGILPFHEPVVKTEEYEGKITIEYIDDRCSSINIIVNKE